MAVGENEGAVAVKRYGLRVPLAPIDRNGRGIGQLNIGRRVIARAGARKRNRKRAAKAEARFISGMLLRDG